MPVSIANQRYFQWMERISHSLSPAGSRNGSRWFAVSDQAEKNRSVKKVLLEKSGKPLFKNIKDRVNLRRFLQGLFYFSISRTRNKEFYGPSIGPEAKRDV